MSRAHCTYEICTAYPLQHAVRLLCHSLSGLLRDTLRDDELHTLWYRVASVLTCGLHSMARRAQTLEIRFVISAAVFFANDVVAVRG
jgi:hypothetical protein